MARLKPEVKCMVVQTAAHDEYFLRVGMGFSSKPRRVGTRGKPCQPGVFTSCGVDTERQFLGYPFQTADGCPLFLVFWTQRIPVGRR